MYKPNVSERLAGIFEPAPRLKEILASADTLEEKRRRIGHYLDDLLRETYRDDPAIPPLEWVVVRNAVNAFRNLVSKRNERVSENGFLKYISELVQLGAAESGAPPAEAFLLELEHLVKGITRRADIYPDTPPAFVSMEGREAAKVRSENLSEIARYTNEYIDRYPNGLDADMIRRRAENKISILKHLEAGESDWQNWAWHVRNSIHHPDTLRALIDLTDDEYRAVTIAYENKIPFGITPYYLSLMEKDASRKLDQSIRAQVIPPPHYVEKMREAKECRHEEMDFMRERDTSPIDGITRRYPKILIIKPILTCPQICVYCQRNWEIEDVDSATAAVPKSVLEKAIQWIDDTPEINEVLITGGDPMMLSDNRIEWLLRKLSDINHVERIRIGTRIPVTLPMRVTDTAAKIIGRFHEPGRREILIITHFESQGEITPESMDAVQKFRKQGIGVYNQLVYTFPNSRKFEAAGLRHRLRLIGVSPYYTFNTKGKDETDDYRVPIARIMQEQQEEARLMPGSVRTDEVVFNVPRLGKNYLRAAQHHELISILPDGRRVYEFHPWEKHMALVDTYVYHDVPIGGYLNRLSALGENMEDYRTVWYYY